MKAIYILIFLFPTLVSAQTKLDSLILNKVNEYRVSLDLDSVKFDTTAFKAANNHSDYLIASDTVMGHKQDNNKFKTPIERYKAFDGTKNSIAEVCNFVSINIKDNELDKIATAVVDAWKNSKDHNAVLISKDYKFAAVSSKVRVSKTGIKNWEHFDVYSCMLFTE